MDNLIMQTLNRYEVVDKAARTRLAELEANGVPTVETDGLIPFPVDGSGGYDYGTAGYAIVSNGDGTVRYEETGTMTEDQGKKNLLANHNEWTEGCHVGNADGMLYSHTGDLFAATGYISVEGISRIVFGDGVAQGAFYDANKSYLAPILIVDGNHPEDIYFNVPSNAAYIRMSVVTTKKNTATIYDAYDIRLKEFVECGSNKEFALLKDAIKFGCENGIKVIVHEGIYDLRQEFAGVETYHDAYGINLYGGVHVVFMPGSYVKALFEPTDEWIRENFQPFYSTGDFILEGLDIEASNTRYCVHDEHGGEGTYHHIFKNCRMKYTNDYTVSAPMYIQCIGGGLGAHGYIEIDGGYYETVDNANNDQLAISYHNGYTSVCDNRIFVKNVYIANEGYMRFTNYGSSTAMSKVFVNGCSMGEPIVHQNENPNYNIVNLEVIEFNNTVRS